MRAVAVVVRLGGSGVSHAAAEVDGHLTPKTLCDTTIGRNADKLPGLDYTCLRCKQVLHREGIGR
jgi:hypothetical protein